MELAKLWVICPFILISGILDRVEERKEKRLDHKEEKETIIERRKKEREERLAQKEQERRSR